jgi:uncharacterized membrane protein
MRRLVVVSLGLIVAAMAASLAVYAHRAAWLPERVPTHWNAAGEVDGWTARDGLLPVLLLMPGAMLFLLGLALALPWLSPEKFRIEPFRATFVYIMLLLQVQFAYLTGVILAGCTGLLRGTDFTRWLVGGLLLVMALLGNVLGKVRRNFYVGVRTPWTLASEAVWVRTHRVAAWTFTAGGLAAFVLVLTGVHPLAALGVFLAAIFVPVVYSLVLYKHLQKLGRLGA